MSFLTKSPKPEIPSDPVPVEAEDLSSSQEAVPVPKFWGKRLIAVRIVTDVLEQAAVETQESYRKK